jgi:hypothetical protein
VGTEAVYIKIIRGAGRCEAVFGRDSGTHGHQVWDAYPHPLPITDHSEYGWLEELYEVCLAFMEKRH